MVECLPEKGKALASIFHTPYNTVIAKRNMAYLSCRVARVPLQSWPPIPSTCVTDVLPSWQLMPVSSSEGSTRVHEVGELGLTLA